MKANINHYSDIILPTEDGEFRIYVDNGFPVDHSEDFLVPLTLHTHSAYEMFYVTRGFMEIVCSNRILTLPENTLLIIPPETLHYAKYGNPQSERYVIAFYTEAVTEKHPFYALFHNMTPISCNAVTDIGNAFSRLHRYYAEHPAIRRPLMASCFYEILYLLKKEILFSETGMPSGAEAAPAIRIANSEYEYRNYVIDNYINRNFNRTISLKTLSEIVHMSERNVNRVIHANYRQSFKERITYLRMKNAVKLLCETDMTLKAVAGAVGYQTVSSFQRCFEKYYGMKPAVYRKLRKEKTEGTSQA